MNCVNKLCGYTGIIWFAELLSHQIKIEKSSPVCYDKIDIICKDISCKYNSLMLERDLYG